jgi:hypothetical protein
MAQRIRFASAVQRACDAEETHNRVSAGRSHRTIRKILQITGAVLSANNDLHKEAAPQLSARTPCHIVALRRWKVADSMSPAIPVVAAVADCGLRRYNSNHRPLTMHQRFAAVAAVSAAKPVAAGVSPAILAVVAAVSAAKLPVAPFSWEHEYGKQRLLVIQRVGTCGASSRR